MHLMPAPPASCAEPALACAKHKHGRARRGHERVASPLLRPCHGCVVPRAATERRRPQAGQPPPGTRRGRAHQRPDDSAAGGRDAGGLRGRLGVGGRHGRRRRGRRHAAARVHAHPLPHPEVGPGVAWPGLLGCQSSHPVCVWWRLCGAGAAAARMHACMHCRVLQGFCACMHACMRGPPGLCQAAAAGPMEAQLVLRAGRAKERGTWVVLPTEESGQAHVPTGPPAPYRYCTPSSPPPPPMPRSPDPVCPTSPAWHVHAPLQHMQGRQPLGRP